MTAKTSATRYVGGEAEVEDFFAALDSFARAVRRARGARVQSASGWLTLSQYGLIEPLADDGQRRVNELAEAAGITGPTATRILDALERRGIVRRTRSADDRRAIAVSMTEEGRRLFEAQRAWVRERERALYDGLPSRQRTMATEILGRFTELIDELAPGPPGDPM
jgi:MarR family transcriptional regulator, organic hydroperoxide resistance regulator